MDSGAVHTPGGRRPKICSFCQQAGLGGASASGFTKPVSTCQWATALPGPTLLSWSPTRSLDQPTPNKNTLPFPETTSHFTLVTKNSNDIFDELKDVGALHNSVSEIRLPWFPRPRAENQVPRFGFPGPAVGAARGSN